MNIAAAVDRRDVGLIDAQALDDVARDAWIERRADAIYDEILLRELGDGATHGEIVRFAEEQAKREAARGDWRKREDD
jgi:hypothetical protein